MGEGELTQILQDEDEDEMITENRESKPSTKRIKTRIKDNRRDNIVNNNRFIRIRKQNIGKNIQEVERFDPSPGQMKPRTKTRPGVPKTLMKSGSLIVKI